MGYAAPHTIDIMNSLTGKVVYTTGKLDYTNATNLKVLPEGNYTILDTKYKWMHRKFKYGDNNNKGNAYNTIRGLRFEIT